MVANSWRYHFNFARLNCPTPEHHQVTTSKIKLPLFNFEDLLLSILMNSEDINIVNFENWLKGIPYEVAFWNSYYGNKKRRKDLFNWSMFNKSCELDDFNIHDYISNLDVKNPRIMDVGCALSYMFGNIINGEAKDVIYLDPLANFYNEILEKHNIDRPRIKFGTFETLSFFFDSDSIDFIHIRNALDHSSDPIQGIFQCLAILKVGGVLYLNHFVNEGENEGYRGFHQYNLREDKGQFIVWNKYATTNVTELIKDFAEVKTTITNEGRIVCVIKKLREVPESVYDPKASAKDSVEKLFKTIEFFNHFPTTLNFQIKRAVCTIGHKTMRLLPYSLLNKIKRLAGK